MKVFVWIGYGCVDIYRVDTLKDIKYLWDEFSGCIEGFGDDEFNKELKKAEWIIEKYEDSDEESQIKSYRQAINHMLDNGIRDSDIDSFEYGTDFSTVKGAPNEASN